MNIMLLLIILLANTSHVLLQRGNEANQDKKNRDGIFLAYLSLLVLIAFLLACFACRKVLCEAEDALRDEETTEAIPLQLIVSNHVD